MITANVIGHLGADVTIHEVNGKSFASFRVGSSESYKDKDGNVVSKTQWVDVTLVNYQGIAPFLKKGVQVYVYGSLSTRVYSSKQDKCMKAGITISCLNLRLLSSKKEGEDSSNSQDGRSYDGF